MQATATAEAGGGGGSHVQRRDGQLGAVQPGLGQRTAR